MRFRPIIRNVDLRPVTRFIAEDDHSSPEVNFHRWFITTDHGKQYMADEEKRQRAAA